MGRNPSDAGRFRILSKELPHYFFRHALAAYTAASVHWPEDVPVGKLSPLAPGVARDLHPARHRHRSNAAVLSDKIHDAPAAVPLLDVCDGQCSYFRPTQAATEKNCQNRSVTQTLYRAYVRRTEQGLRL